MLIADLLRPAPRHAYSSYSRQRPQPMPSPAGRFVASFGGAAVCGSLVSHVGRVGTDQIEINFLTLSSSAQVRRPRTPQAFPDKREPC